jgi:hypothetical protein
MNLFTYRSLIEWLNNPFGTPKLMPIPEQLSLNFRRPGQLSVRRGGDEITMSQGGPDPKILDFTAWMPYPIAVFLSKINLSWTAVKFLDIHRNLLHAVKSGCFRLVSALRPRKKRSKEELICCQANSTSKFVQQRSFSWLSLRSSHSLPAPGGGGGIIPLV